MLTPGEFLVVWRAMRHPMRLLCNFCSGFRNELVVAAVRVDGLPDRDLVAQQPGSVLG